MGRFSADQAENYGGNGGAGFFSLKNDGDVARVRIMYNGIEDVEGLACHEVQVDGKKRYVNCLRDYNEPLSKCPMCEAKHFQVAKLYIPIYDIDEDKVKWWERGKKFFGKISSLCSRYANLVSHEFEIERHGKAGDTSTTYEIYEVNKDDTTLEDLPEIPELIGGLILDKNADEMNYYLQYGEFESTESNDSNDMPVRRRNSEDRNSRRTPARGRRGSDEF